MPEKEAVKEILRQALDADEKGDKDVAVELYTKAVETILKIGDPALRERLNKYAVQALDRAEELRGISSPKRQATNVDETPANSRVQSKCLLALLIFFPFYSVKCSFWNFWRFSFRYKYKEIGRWK